MDKSKMKRGGQLNLYIEIFRYGHGGKINLLEHKKIEANSFVKGFLACLGVVMENVTDNQFATNAQSGVSITPAQGTALISNPGAGTTFLGILIGTSNVAVTKNDSAMGAQVSVNWTYGATTYIFFGTLNGWSVQIERTFTNNTGASVTITELGLAVGGSSLADVAHTILALHDIIAGQAVANGTSITFRYSIEGDP